VNSTYYFYSVAIDGAGNRENPPLWSDALTYVFATEPVMTVLTAGKTNIQFGCENLMPGWSNEIEQCGDILTDGWYKAEGFLATDEYEKVILPVSNDWIRMFYRLHSTSPNE
jgi:hypothetical protein